jgi:hypothetical protein
MRNKEKGKKVIGFVWLRLKAFDLRAQGEALCENVDRRRNKEC